MTFLGQPQTERSPTWNLAEFLFQSVNLKNFLVLDLSPNLPELTPSERFQSSIFQ